VGYVGKHLSKSVHIDKPLTNGQLIAAGGELFNLAKRRKELGLTNHNIEAP